MLFLLIILSKKNNDFKSHATISLSQWTKFKCPSLYRLVLARNSWHDLHVLYVMIKDT